MDTDILIDLICRQQQVLVQLRDLSRRQASLSDAGDITSLLGLLAAKQTLINDLRQIDGRLRPFRDQDPESRRWRSAADRQQCQRASQTCAELLSEIVALEQDCKADTPRGLRMVDQRFQDSRCVNTARQAYACPENHSHNQLDLSSVG